MSYISEWSVPIEIKSKFSHISITRDVENRGVDVKFEITFRLDDKTCVKNSNSDIELMNRLQIMREDMEEQINIWRRQEVY